MIDAAAGATEAPGEAQGEGEGGGCCCWLVLVLGAGGARQAKNLVIGAQESQRTSPHARQWWRRLRNEKEP